MKKLLLSSVVLVATVALVGGTYAYYNDSETSTGNTFASGAIDLKIDHTYASYNGYLCDESCEEDTNTNLVENGSFETPVVSGDWNIFGTVPGWDITWESTQTNFGGFLRPETAFLEIHRSAGGWPHADGEQHVELDADWNGPVAPGPNQEPAQVRITQDILTTPGDEYVLRFAFAARPNTGTNDNQLLVEVADGALASDTIIQSSGGSVTWVEHSYSFTALATSTKITFADVSPLANASGVFLDDVRVHPTLCTGGFGDPQQNACELWESTDLVGERFFTFEDVKPGDHGKHVVSFHVEDNPAWTCLVAHSGTDSENTNTESEQSAGDTSVPEGELSSELELFGWDDLDGDGVFEPSDGEVPLFTEYLADFTGFPFHDSGTGNGTHLPGTVEYLGLSWCAGSHNINLTTGAIACDGSVMGNEAQTDSYVGSIGGYAEQVRNNQTFSCAALTLPVEDNS